MTHSSEICTEGTDDGGVDYYARCTCGWESGLCRHAAAAEDDSEDHATFVSLVGGPRKLSAYAEWVWRGAHGHADANWVAISIDGIIYGFSAREEDDCIGAQAVVLDLSTFLSEHLKIVDPPIFVEVREVGGPPAEGSLLYATHEVTGRCVLEIGDRVVNGKPTLTFKIDLAGYDPAWLVLDVAATPDDEAVATRGVP